MEHSMPAWLEQWSFRRIKPMISQESPQRHARSCYLTLPRSRCKVGLGGCWADAHSHLNDGPGKWRILVLGPWTSLVFSLISSIHIWPHLLVFLQILLHCNLCCCPSFSKSYSRSLPFVPLTSRILLYTSTSCVQPYRAFPIIRESEISQGSASA